MFVFAANDNIFYFRLGVVEAEIEPDSLHQDDKKLSNPAQDIKLSPKTPRSPEVARKLNNASVGISKENFLLLEFFGVDLPTADITNNFINLVESKLSVLTHSTLGIFLSRSVTVRLTKADIEFLIPIQKPPTRIERVKIPDRIKNPYFLLLMLKQSLLGELHYLVGSDVSPILRSYYQHKYGLNSELSGYGQNKYMHVSKSF
jgi:hypothetical protein